MASCTRIEGMVQAYVDDELSASDRVILEQHLSACRDCNDHLRRHRRLCAELFEVYSDKRLGRDLSRPVVENLPEMEMLSSDLAGVNWRAKHRVRGFARVARYLPAVAFVVVVVLGFMIRSYWPGVATDGDSIGLVMQCTGPARHVAPDGTAWTGVSLEGSVKANERFETGPSGALMLGLKGPTTIKVNENSRIKVDDARRVSVERGEVLLDIGRDGELFRVTTPDGNITVFGTVFAVRVTRAGTTVQVERGEVLVGNDKHFTSVTHGQEARLSAEDGLSGPGPCDTKVVAAWSKAIAPEAGAERSFHQMVVAQSRRAELPAKAMFSIEPPAGRRRWEFTSINVYWQPDVYREGHCSYDLFVYDDQMHPLFMERIAGSAFDDRLRSSLELPVPGAPITGVSYLIVRLVPDYSTGRIEPAGVTVSGMAQGIDS